jgi:protein O-mannosyl-transferase
MVRGMDRDRADTSIGARKGRRSATARGTGPIASRAGARAAGPGLAVRVLTLAALAALTSIAFAGVVRNGWVRLDDPTYVTENPHIARGLTLDGFLWSLHEPHGGNWHPLTSWSHMLDVQLFGLDAGAHHAVSLAVHLANVLLLVVVLRRLTGDWWRSVLVGALFGLHPLRVESVAWVSERKDVLSMFFLLLTIEAYRRWVVTPGRWRFAALLVALALGLMSKPMLVSAPLLLLLLDVWPLRRVKGLLPVPGASSAAYLPRPFGSLLLEKWPLFGLAAASGIATILAQRASGAVSSTTMVPIPERLANAVVSYWRYVGKTCWPTDLIPFYPWTPVPLGRAVIAAMALVLVSVIAIAQLRRRPHLAVGWAWYLVTLLPVIGLLQVGGQAYADRYTYIPAIGLAVGLAWSLGDRRGVTSVIATAVAVLAVGGSVVATRRQVRLWKDTPTLFAATLRVNPENGVAHNSLGVELMVEGRLEEALRELQTAERIAPAYVEPHLNLGQVLHRLGRDAESVREFRIGLAARPDDPEVLVHLAQSTLGAGDLVEAIRLSRRALELRPDDPAALRQLALALGLQGDVPGAIALLRRAESRAPGDPDVQHLLGKLIYLSGGPASEAIAHLRRAIEARPGWPPPLGTLATILATDPDPVVRDTSEALRLATRAVESSGGRESVALLALASARAATGDFSGAVEMVRRAEAQTRAVSGDSAMAALTAMRRRYERGIPPPPAR